MADKKDSEIGKAKITELTQESEIISPATLATLTANLASKTRKTPENANNLSPVEQSIRDTALDTVLSLLCSGKWVADPLKDLRTLWTGLFNRK